MTSRLHIIKCTPYGSHTDNPIKDLCGAQIPNPYGPSVGCIRACPYRTHTDKLIWAFLGTQAKSPYRYHELRPIDRLLPLSLGSSGLFSQYMSCEDNKDFLSNKCSMRTRYLHFNTIVPK